MSSSSAAIVSQMINFIEQKEREFQASKLTDNQGKADIVKSILDELERVTTNENK